MTIYLRAWLNGRQILPYGTTVLNGRQSLPYGTTVLNGRQSLPYGFEAGIFRSFASLKDKFEGTSIIVNDLGESHPYFTIYAGAQKR